VNGVGQHEIRTQRSVIDFFKKALGYHYLGYWKDRDGNSAIEETYLIDWLKRQGHSDKIIKKVLFELGKAAALGGSKTLYDANREVYAKLRYGVKVKRGAGEQFETVWLIDWATPVANHFAVAEEVTVLGQHTKRPDVVLYVNGIAQNTQYVSPTSLTVATASKKLTAGSVPCYVVTNGGVTSTVNWILT